MSKCLQSVANLFLRAGIGPSFAYSSGYKTGADWSAASLDPRRLPFSCAPSNAAAAVDVDDAVALSSVDDSSSDITVVGIVSIRVVTVSSCTVIVFVCLLSARNSDTTAR
jgi:hypothetical protein